MRLAAIIVAKAGCAASDTCRDDILCTSRADQLIELHVGYRRYQREVVFLLPDNLVARRERDKRFEPTTHSDGHAIFDFLCDGVMQTSDFIHRPLCTG